MYNLNTEIGIKEAKAQLNYFYSEGKTIEIKEVKKVRSLRQNAYLHVCITLYACNFGYTIEETKFDLKMLCPFMHYEKNGKKYVKKTSSKNSKELTDFIEWIRNYSVKNGFYIPTSNEYVQEQEYYKKVINQNKQYL